METMIDKYLHTLREIGDWTTVSEWAVKFGDLFPDLLEKAEREAANQKNDTTGLREIAARISSRISRGAFGDSIEVDDSERPRKIRPLNPDETSERIEREIEEDTLQLSRAQRIKADFDALGIREKYRIDEMESISKSLNALFRLDFEVDHAVAILNGEEPGRHHPENLQLILKGHNRMKSSKNWRRFTFEEQIEYIRSVVAVQKIVAGKMNVELDESVIGSLVERLKLVF